MLGGAGGSTKLAMDGEALARLMTGCVGCEVGARGEPIIEPVPKTSRDIMVSRTGS